MLLPPHLATTWILLSVTLAYAAHCPLQIQLSGLLVAATKLLRIGAHAHNLYIQFISVNGHQSKTNDVSAYCIP